MTIWENVKKYKTKGLSLNLNEDRSGCRKTERTQEDKNLLKKAYRGSKNIGHVRKEKNNYK